MMVQKVCQATKPIIVVKFHLGYRNYCKSCKQKFVINNCVYMNIASQFWLHVTKFSKCPLLVFTSRLFCLCIICIYNIIREWNQSKETCTNS